MQGSGCWVLGAGCRVKGNQIPGRGAASLARAKSSTVSAPKTELLLLFEGLGSMAVLGSGLEL